MLNIYKIEITETLQRQIEVEANSKEEAERIAKQKYQNEEVVLSSDDYVDTSISVIEQRQKKKYMER
ncbi:MAG: DpnD/PcfM family protein [Firmicutes bacterium]|nr:DpnD/PcfM family protein [Bacillota bacterium]